MTQGDAGVIGVPLLNSSLQAIDAVDLIPGRAV
jgi:hypothetical protein